MQQAHIRGKTIDVTDIKYMLVESDHCESIQFVVKAQFSDEVDLSTFAFVLRWQDADGEGADIPLEKTVSDGKVYLSFTPGGSFTAKTGRMTIQLRGAKTVNGVAFNWNSETSNIYIDSLLSPESPTAPDPSVYQQVLNRMAELDEDVAAAGEAKNAAIAAKDLAVSSKDTAVSASGTAVSAKDIAVQSKNDAQTAKTDAVAAKTAAETAKEEARAYAEIAEAAGGTYAVVINEVPYSILFCVDDDQTHLGLKFSPISA